jgi:putative hydrolase
VEIIVSSDAHIDTDICKYDLAYEVLKEVNFPEELIINRSIEKFKHKINLNRIAAHKNNMIITS